MATCHSQTANLDWGIPMLTAEHEQAEALRRVRLKACAPQRAGGLDFRWLLKLLGWTALGENPTKL
jgi:hypothetical protein